MSSTVPQYKAFTLVEDDSQSFDIKRIILKYLYYWPLFVISIVLCVALAVIYLRSAETLFVVKSTLLIKDHTKLPVQESALQRIDFMNSNKIIENEVEILKSNHLIKQVVENLQLWVKYHQVDGFSTHEFYKSGPVKFNLLSSTDALTESEITIVIKDDKSFFLISDSNEQCERFFKDTFINRFGTWKLEPTDHLMRYKGSQIKISMASPENVALEYQDRIVASLPNKLTTAVVLSIQDPIASRGKDVLNGLISAYNLAGSTELNRETKNTLDFLDQRIAGLTSELTEAERGIEGFKSSRGLTDISSESRISLENLQANDTRLNEINVKLTVIDGIERYINSPQSTEKSTATLGISDPALTNLIERLAQLQLQRDRLLATTPETNPDFEPINRQIVSTMAAIKENVKNIRMSLLSTRKKLQSFNTLFESSIKNIPTQEREYISIKRQQSIKENLYTYLLQKREEVAVKYASAVSSDRIVDHAYIEAVNVHNRIVILAFAILLGTALPVGLLFARGILGNRLTDIKEIKDGLDLPVISEIQFDNRQNQANISALNITAIGEQFRTLRIKHNNLFENHAGVVSLVTSGVSGEGKSFISKHLALAFAYAGKKTVILELDLRKPKIIEFFELPSKHVGISDFLNGDAGLSDIIQQIEPISGLHIIGSGTAAKNPSELLEKHQLKDLISRLKGMYDHVIIDSPPVHLVPDAIILSKMSDITLYVIRQGFTHKSELAFIKDITSQKLLTNVNLIFNGIERVKYGYGYDYKASYYGDYRSHQKLGGLFGNFSSRF